MDNSLPEKSYLAALALADGLGGVSLARVMRFFDSAAEAWLNGTVNDYLAAGLTMPQAKSVTAHASARRDLPQKLLELCDKRGITLIGIDEELYPRLLKEIYAPPVVLYCRGELRQEDSCLAMVGSRRMTPYGKKAAELIGNGLANAGVTVVSGAAYGIDGASHNGALKSDSGRTIAVLGCGVDVAYPQAHRRLLEEIAERGAVISEYPPGTPPQAAFFPMRNRIIAGMSHGTVVIEAAERSGSLITAELALSEGRDVFAVPGSIFSVTSEGTNRLILQGAKLVRSAADIIAEYPWLQPDNQKKAGGRDGKSAGPQLSSEEQQVYDLLLPDKPLTVDDIIFRLHGRGDASNIAFVLLQLEMKGLIETDANHGYTRNVIC
ncbi:MAG: DNA-processing protein DprA [Selenomonadaceae bacterium]|nr:DNA-processing protein DprA [Selenomonadaceae bacterium]